jgi:hypothetical protein
VEIGFLAARISFIRSSLMSGWTGDFGVWLGFTGHEDGAERRKGQIKVRSTVCVINLKRIFHQTESGGDRGIAGIHAETSSSDDVRVDSRRRVPEIVRRTSGFGSMARRVTHAGR